MGCAGHTPGDQRTARDWMLAHRAQLHSVQLAAAAGSATQCAEEEVSQQAKLQQHNGLARTCTSCPMTAGMAMRPCSATSLVMYEMTARGRGGSYVQRRAMCASHTGAAGTLSLPHKAAPPKRMQVPRAMLREPEHRPSWSGLPPLRQRTCHGHGPALLSRHDASCHVLRWRHAQQQPAQFGWRAAGLCPCHASGPRTQPSSNNGDMLQRCKHLALLRSNSR